MADLRQYFPEGQELTAQIQGRHRRGTIMRTLFLSSTIVAIIVLGALVYNIVNQAFGLVALENEIDPAELVADYYASIGEPVPANADLAALPKDTLIAVLQENISKGLGRRLERDRRFYADSYVFDSEERYMAACADAEPPTGCTAPEHTQQSVYNLIAAEVVKPRVEETWTLVESLTQRAAIERLAAADFPEAEVVFRSWISADFLTNPQDPEPEIAGVRTAIIGSLWVILIVVAFSFPIGVGSAIYLEEYADQSKWYNRLIQTNINNLAGVPSIIYGLLGVAVFVRALGFFTSGAAFGVDTANGRTILSAGLTLGLLILPIIIINAQEAVRAVPNSTRMASYGLGATKWQTIWNHVLPQALPGIMTGTILSMSRAIGETAPLVVVGASTLITVDPNGPFSKFTVLPIQIYQWTSRPQGGFQNIAAAAIIVLLVLLLTLNATAVLIRNRYANKAG